MSKDDRRLKTVDGYFFNFEKNRIEDEDGNIMKTRSYKYQSITNFALMDDLSAAINNVDKAYLKYMQDNQVAAKLSIETAQAILITHQKRVVLGTLADVLAELKIVE